MRPLILVLIVWVLVVRPASTQDLTFPDFLRSARTAPAVTGFDAQLDWFSEKRYRLPWVNELELRTQNNVMINGRQQYRARLDIANPLTVRNNNLYFEAQQSLKRIRRDLVLKDELKNRYLLAVQWLAAKERLKILTESERLAQKRVQIQEEQAGSSRFNPDNYLEARVDLVTRTVDRHKAEVNVSLLESRMSALAYQPGNKPVFTVESIRPETISLLSDTLSLRMSVTGIRVQISTIELAERRARLDRSRIDFAWLQGIYAPYRQGTENHPTGFALGVTVPIFNQNKNDVARSELNALEEKAKLEELKSRVSLDQQGRLAALRGQLKMYVRTRELIDSLDAGNRQDIHRIARNFDPVADIRTQMQVQRLALVLQDVREKVMEEWILLLDGMDLLAGEPWINYLSENLERLD